MSNNDSDRISKPVVDTPDDSEPRDIDQLLEEFKQYFQLLLCRRWAERSRQLPQSKRLFPYLPIALSACAHLNEPLPSWLAEDYLSAFARIQNLEVSSWDDVFGRPIRKGRQLASSRKLSRNLMKVYPKVQERHQAGKAINDDLFRAVGKELGLGLTLTKELYRDGKILAMAVEKSGFLQKLSEASHLTDELRQAKVHEAIIRVHAIAEAFALAAAAEPSKPRA